MAKKPAITMANLFARYVEKPPDPLPPEMVAKDHYLTRAFFYDAGAAIFHVLTHNLRVNEITPERWEAVNREIALPDTRDATREGTLQWWFADALKDEPPELRPHLEQCFYAGTLATLLVITEGKLDVPRLSGMKTLGRELDAIQRVLKNESRTVH